MMGPTPCALTIAQMKKAIPAIGTTNAFAVNRWRLVRGNTIRGSDQLAQDVDIHFVNREPDGG